MMWDVLTTGIIFLVINGLKVFDMIWVLEYSRPGKETCYYFTCSAETPAR